MRSKTIRKKKSEHDLAGWEEERERKWEEGWKERGLRGEDLHWVSEGNKVVCKITPSIQM